MMEKKISLPTTNHNRDKAHVNMLFVPILAQRKG